MLGGRMTIKREPRWYFKYVGYLTPVARIVLVALKR
jgi:hypothetical protein